MAGWKLKNGELINDRCSEEEYWRLFNYVFSKRCHKRNTYKFALIKSLLDNLLNSVQTEIGFSISFYDLFLKFTQCYWNLVLKHHLRQMRRQNDVSESAIEKILNEYAAKNTSPLDITLLEFSSLSEKEKNKLVSKVKPVCKQYVLGALFEDFEGEVFGFDTNEEELFLSYGAYDFMLKFKPELEKLNYYCWAQFLESVNEESQVVRLLDKLEESIPQRQNLSIYRQILYEEFEQNNCFYCGKKLDQKIAVDHFIPWNFTKEDKIWNFVLACPSCNSKKLDRLVEKEYIRKIDVRNRRLRAFRAKVVKDDFLSYHDGLIDDMWIYARNSGYKEIEVANCS